MEQEDSRMASKFEGESPSNRNGQSVAAGAWFTLDFGGMIFEGER